ncbi:hypothetical protein X975_16498, partial [Stegodyphus mimosarum]
MWWTKCQQRIQLQQSEKGWPVVLFFTLLNTAAINDRVLLQCSKHSSLQHSQFLRDLATDFLKDYTAERCTQPCLPRHLQEKLASKSKEPTAKKQKVFERKRG